MEGGLRNRSDAMPYRNDFDALQAHQQVLTERINSALEENVALHKTLEATRKELAEARKERRRRRLGQMKPVLGVILVVFLCLSYLTIGGMCYSWWEDPTYKKGGSYADRVDGGAVALAVVWPLVLPCKAGSWIYGKMSGGRR